MSLPDPLATVLRLMPSEYHTGGLQDADPLVRLWATGHAMGWVCAMGYYADESVVGPVPSVLTEALSALRSQAQREADRG